MADPQPFVISDLRGGINNSDTALTLRPDEMTDARNIDFREGACGAKRRGSLGISMTSAIFDSAIVATFRHTPTNLIANDELWALDANGHLDRRVAGVWQGGVARSNDFVTIDTNNYDANAVSLHGKLFIAAANGADRLLVWDGTVLRWAGIAQPSPPTGADSGGGGSYSSTRYARIRYTQQVSGVTVRRSEPSTVLTIAPSGVNASYTLTKPSGTEATTSVKMEQQTHWEVEFSLDNVLFYRVATVAIGTATYVDSTSSATGYSAGTLSETIGEYVPPMSVRHLAVDEDRVIMGGSHETPGYDSTVWWTPVTADDGVGNDERVPVETKQRITFDGLDGGPVTALVAGVSNAVRVFKRSRIHKMVRTGILASAYDPVVESPSRGALMRCAVASLDKDGNACVDFLDDAAGLCRLGRRGLEDLGRSVKTSWERRNKAATFPPRIIHYPHLEQVWYSVSVDAGTTPTLLFVHETQFGANLLHDGLPARARAFTLFPQSDGVLRPVFGTSSEALSPSGTSYLHVADTGGQDNGVSYQAYGVTRPFLLGGLFQRFGILAARLVAAAASATLQVRLIRDFGLETLDRTVSLAAAGSEPTVIKTLDSESLSELSAIQVQFGDASASSQTWSVDQMAFLPRSEGRP